MQQQQKKKRKEKEIKEKNWRLRAADRNTVLLKEKKKGERELVLDIPSVASVLPPPVKIPFTNRSRKPPKVIGSQSTGCACVCLCHKEIWKI